MFDAMADRWHDEGGLKAPPPTPRVLVPEQPFHDHSVLPRGPKMIANAVNRETWQAEWFWAVSEELDNPKSGGESFGLRFAHWTDGRHGWAVWVAGKFLGAFLWASRGAIVPQRLSAKELKEVLSW